MKTSQLTPTTYPAGEITHPNTTYTAIHLDQATPQAILTLLQTAAQQEHKTHAIIPYFPNARADKTGNYDIKPIAKIIATGNFNKVTILDPHSSTSHEIIHNELAKKKIPLTTKTTLDIIQNTPTINMNNYTAIIAPDKGAHNRAQLIANHYNLPLIQAHKQRNQQTGKITHYTFPKTTTPLNNVLVVDDICDGGATFNLLRQSLPHNADLYISHPVFSGKAEQNLQDYANIYTTDSLATHTNIKRAHITPIKNII